MDSSQVDRLERFCRRVDELLASRFLALVKSNGIQHRFRWTKTGGLTEERIGPDEDAIKAAVLDLRFFTQDNELSSLRQMDAFIASLPASQDLKTRFSDTRAKLNQYLDTAGPFAVHVDNSAITRREILWAHMYGKYAHEVDAHTEALAKWKSFHASDTLRAELDGIILNFANALRILRGICQEILRGP